jgi:hypothetical protein
MEPKKVKVLNTSSLQINENDASRLVGSIVEKGISDSQNNNPTVPFHSFPKPTVIPFPVARHRSHGPVSSPDTPSVTLFLSKLQRSDII